jgi:hypothetical protein
MMSIFSSKKDKELPIQQVDGNATQVDGNATQVDGNATQVDRSVPPPAAPVPPPAVVTSYNFKNNKANRITIDIYGKNDPAYGGDVLFITMSDPFDFAGDLPVNSTPLNKSNYNILNAFINEKLSPDFKNAFNKNINSGTKGFFQMGAQTTFGMAKSEIQKKLYDTTISPELRDAITKFSAQMNGLAEIADADVTSWRLPDCTVAYDVWNTKTVGDVYHIIVGKPTSATTSNVKDMSVIRESVKTNLAQLKGLIGDANNAQKGQASSIDTLVTQVDTIVDKQLNTLDTNLKGMFVIDAKNPDTSKQSNSKIVNNTYRNIWYDNANKLFFTKQMNVMQGKSAAGINPLTGNELLNILTTGFIMQGGKTKKHNKLHKRRNNRKTNKK